MQRRLALALLSWLAATPVAAVQPDEVLPDPALEARARALSAELRCMVCQNQSIDDSDAPLARDLRILLRERLAAGDSNEQVIDFLVARYGEFILLRPRLTWHTALLWIAPPAILAIGGVIAVVAFRRRRLTAEVVQLTPAEQEELDGILRHQVGGGPTLPKFNPDDSRR
jgi:cytochrome c-type biogenesis protein CcmH